MISVPFNALESFRDKLARDAAMLRDYGAEAQAVTVEHCLAQLQATIDTAAKETVSMSEAVDVSGYSARQLNRMIGNGKLVNVGTPHRPRFVRSSLPRKNKMMKDDCAQSHDRVSTARAILNQ